MPQIIRNIALSSQNILFCPQTPLPEKRTVQRFKMCNIPSSKLASLPINFAHFLFFPFATAAIEWSIPGQRKGCDRTWQLPLSKHESRFGLCIIIAWRWAADEHGRATVSTKGVLQDTCHLAVPIGHIALLYKIWWMEIFSGHAERHYSFLLEGENLPKFPEVSKATLDFVLQVGLDGHWKVYTSERK